MEYGGRRIVVLGLGRSGQAAARFLLPRGAALTLLDDLSSNQLPATVWGFQNQGAEVRSGPLTAEHLPVTAELVVRSPGVPGDHPVLTAARTRGLPVWSELELAARHLSGTVVGITGTNGKSTVTALVHAILSTHLPRVTMGGNIGTPLSALLSQDDPETVHVVEVSSFQLEDIERFRARVAVLLNVAPDHLDRYPDFAAYVAAKGRLLETQTPDDLAILRGEDPALAGLVPRGRVRRFRREDDGGEGAFVGDGRVWVRSRGTTTPVLACADIPLPGRHNVENVLAAVLVAEEFQVPVEETAAAIGRFPPLPHRFQPVGTRAGITFVNDSKATNVDAVVRALEAVEGRCVLILGGRDKGSDFQPLAATLGEKVAGLVFIGEAGPRIRDVLSAALESTLPPATVAGTMDDAVAQARDLAGEGGTVLLSPACASFDWYASYAERGHDFQRAVQALAEAPAP